MENPFRSSKLSTIVEAITPNLGLPGLPVRQGQSYDIPRTLPYAYYNYGIGPSEVSQNGVTGNLMVVQRIQNNHTEILSYITRVLFEEIIEPQRTEISQKEPEAQNVVNYTEQIKSLQNQLEEIKKQLQETNKKLDTLSKQIA